MTKIFSFIIPLVFFSSSLFGRFVPGNLIFSFTPQSPGATASGTWEAIVFCPDETTVSTGAISATSSDVVVLNCSCSPEGYTEVGTYFVKFKSYVTNSEQAFLSSISVACDSTEATIDTMVFKNLPVLNYGENTELCYHVLAQ